MGIGYLGKPGLEGRIASFLPPAMIAISFLLVFGTVSISSNADCAPSPPAFTFTFDRYPLVNQTANVSLNMDGCGRWFNTSIYLDPVASAGLVWVDGPVVESFRYHSWNYVNGTIKVIEAGSWKMYAIAHEYGDFSFHIEDGEVVVEGTNYRIFEITLTVTETGSTVDRLATEPCHSCECDCDVPLLGWICIIIGALLGLLSALATVIAWLRHRKAIAIIFLILTVAAIAAIIFLVLATTICVC